MNWTVLSILTALCLCACGRSSGTGSSLDGGSGGGGVPFGGLGPWGTNNASYGTANGILEQPVIGISTDESQNLWVATNAALYLLQPGQTTFRRYGAQAGLHLTSNPVTYCDKDFTDGDKACPIQGAAVGPGISEITGGGPNEVLVGYYGHDDGPADWFDSNRHTGKLDRVRLNGDLTISVARIDFVSSDTPQFWHNRTVHRLVYDHFVHPHELYVGTNHGIDRIQPDRYRPPNPGEWFLVSDREYLSDHLHPQVCDRTACTSSESGLKLGDWKGIALSPDGNLWVGGRWAAGEILYSTQLADWSARGGKSYRVAFGDPYVAAGQPGSTCNEIGFCNQPVYPVPFEGDVVSITATAVAADGKIWFASGRVNTSDTPRGLAYWDGHNFHYFDPISDAGMAEEDIRDLLALPDGRLVLASAKSGLVFWNPQTGAHQTARGPAWLPDDHVLRLELDQMVSPPALHVATYGGAASIRQLP